MSLEQAIEWLTVRDAWRAHVGRLPRGHEPRLRTLVSRFGANRALRAIGRTRDSGLRRTAERWAFFLSLYGEAP
jgi:hypothetical protein